MSAPAPPGSRPVPVPPPELDGDPFAPLAGEVVWVTGAARGIGAAVASAFVARGARVVASDLAFPAGIAPWSPAGAPSGRVHATTREDGQVWRARVDVTSEHSVEALADAIEDHPDLGTVGVLVNCAGSSTLSRVVDTSVDQWEFNQGLNARGSFLTARAVARRLETAGRPGRIILIASQAAKNGYRCLGAYVASKHAVLGLTRTLALEEAPFGITVNAVCPGIIETDMKRRERVQGGELRGMTAAQVEAEDNSQVPLGRTGQPEDVAGVCLFLASDLAAYMTGQGVNVTGGMTMH